MTETPASSIRPPSERHPYLVLLLDNLGKLVGVTLIAGALLMGFDALPAISREIKVVGLAYLVFLWPGSYVGNWIQENRDDPQAVIFVDVDAHDLEGGIALIPLADFSELEVTDGELDQWAPLLYAGRNLDLDEMTCEGVWTGTLTDRELIASLQAVYDCREMLEDDAKRAFAYETNLWSIVRSATKNGVLEVVKMFERNSLPDEGEGIENAVDDALEQFGLEGRISSPDDLEDVDLDDLDDHLEDGPTDDNTTTDADADDATDDQQNGTATPLPTTNDD